MIIRGILAGFCLLIVFVALAIVVVMPSPMVLADPIARLTYIALTLFLIVIACGAFLVMLTILDGRE